MSLMTAIRKPGHGRRQADPVARLEAENARLRHQLEGAGKLILGLQMDLADIEAGRVAEVREVARQLGDTAHALLQERHEHFMTRCRLETAVRSNESNAEAVTVQTDVTALRAAPADRFHDAPPPGPQYAAYRRVVASPTITVLPLWDSPLAAHPANIPAAVQ